MGTDDHALVTTAGDGCNDAVLPPWVREVLHVHAVLVGARFSDGVVDLLEEPFAGLAARIGLCVGGGATRQQRDHVSKAAGCQEL